MASSPTPMASGSYGAKAPPIGARPLKKDGGFDCRVFFFLSFSGLGGEHPT